MERPRTDRERGMKRLATREQRMAVVYGVLSIVLLLVVLQLWLLTATMNAWLGGDSGVVLPALGASAFCLLVNLALLRVL